MPFKSEKQRRYLWANEPEIARDWTDTYGSGIHKALGGRIGFYRGSDRHAGTGGRRSSGMDMSGATHKGGTTRDVPDRGPINPHQDTTPVLQQQLHTDDLNRRRQLGLLATRDAQNKINYPKPGPKVGGGGIKNFLGNWGSTIGGSQLGAGLGSMLLGPWGMLLGSIFGGGAGRRAYQASQTDEKETIRDILFGNPNTKDTILSNLFNPQPKAEGIETVYPRRSSEEIQKIADLNNMGYDEVINLMFNRDQIKPVSSTGQRNDLVQEAGLLDFFTGGDKEEVDVNIYGKPETITHGGKTYEMPSKVKTTTGQEQLEGRALENYIKANEAEKQFYRENPEMIPETWLVGEDL